MDLSIHDPLTMLVFVGLIIFIIPLLKITNHSIEVPKGNRKYPCIIGAIACIAGVGVYLFVDGSAMSSTSQEKLTTEDTAETRTTEETQTPAETQTINTQSGAPSISDSQSIAKPPQVDIKPYLTWRFTTSDHKPNMRLRGSKFVLATIHIENKGDVPISSGPSCWYFFYNGIYYYYDDLTGLYNLNGYPDINPGENGTFTIAYVVEGNPTDNASLAYVNPYFF